VEKLASKKPLREARRLRKTRDEGNVEPKRKDREANRFRRRFHRAQREVVRPI